MQNKYFDIKNLNSSWVIIKKHNSNTFFKSRVKSSFYKNYPSSECIFYDEHEIRLEVEKLNINRKKCKYSYENASKHFINMWYTNKWNYNTIFNSPYPIKQVSSTTNLSSFQSLKDTVLEETAREIKNKIFMINKLKEEAEQAIENLKQNYSNKIKECEDKKIAAEVKLQEFTQLDLKILLKPYETQGDKLVKVLYGAKEKILEKQDIKV